MSISSAGSAVEDGSCGHHRFVIQIHPWPDSVDFLWLRVIGNAVFKKIPARRE